MPTIKRRHLYKLAATLSAAIVMPAHAQGTATEPTAFELEFWRSAARINTVAAYEEYLAKFPSGSFATLARIAAKRAIDVGAGATASAQASDTRPLIDLQALRSLQVETGAITFAVGDQFYGPGPLTVGWWGAKRQLILPKGEWILLSAYDHTVSSFTTLQLTTLAFGQFRGNELQSLLVFTSNTRSFPPGTGGIAASPIAMSEQCSADGPSVHMAEQESNNRRQMCTSVRTVPDAELPAAVPPHFARRLAASLERLKASYKSPMHRSALEVLAPGNYYSSYVRLDAIQSTVSTDRVASMRAFREKALLGIENKLALTDLEPGLRSTAVGLELID